MHARVYFHADRQRSRRYTRSIITDAINVAVDNYIQDRYDNIRKSTGYSFERVERIRQELDPLVIRVIVTPVVGSPNTFAAPAAMRYALLSFVEVGGSYVLLQEPSLNQADREQNDFLQASADYPYVRRYGGGVWKVFPGSGNTATNWELYYLNYQNIVTFGDAVITAGPTVLTVGQFYNVVEGSVVHNGVTYTLDQSFQAVNQVLTGTGQVALFTDSILPKTAHEEICVDATAILMGNFENYDKRQLKEAERVRQ